MCLHYLVHPLDPFLSFFVLLLALYRAPTLGQSPYWISPGLLRGNPASLPASPPAPPVHPSHSCPSHRPRGAWILLLSPETLLAAPVTARDKTEPLSSALRLPLSPLQRPRSLWPAPHPGLVGFLLLECAFLSLPLECPAARCLRDRFLHGPRGSMPFPS